MVRMQGVAFLKQSSKNTNMPSASDERILLNPEVLRDSHLPDYIFSRENEVQEILNCLSPVLKKRRPMHVWLHGPVGTGKTLLARHILERFKQQHDISGAYINCWERRTYFEVLDSLITQLRILRAEQQRTNLKLEKLRKFLGTSPFLLVLDEVDHAVPRERNALLYGLSTIPNIGVIYISSGLSTLSTLEQRVRSRINPMAIRLEPYKPDELVLMLKDRAERALKQSSWNVIILQRIADLAQGDARLALQTLRNAADLAELDVSATITHRHVRRGWHNATDIERNHLLQNLTEDHRILYRLIKREGELLSGELWKLYLRTCRKLGRKPVAVRTFSDYANELKHTGLIHVERARVKGRVRVFKTID